MARGGSRRGAGRPGQHGKVEDHLRVDLRELFRSGQAPKSATRISIAVGEPINLFSQRVNLTRTACALGGTTSWFECPGCKRRVVILHLRDARFACRRCHGLVYRSQSATKMAKAFTRLFKLQGRLKTGWDWDRPKGMHFNTFTGLLERALPHASSAERLMTAKTENIARQLECLEHC